MVQTTEARHRSQLCARCRLRLDGPMVRGIFFERVMNSVVMVIAYVILDESEQMSFVQRDDMVQDLARQLPTQRSAVPFCQGDLMLVRFGFRPVAFRNVITSASYFESRSRIT